MGKILDFLFGKSAKIFDEKGNIRHDFDQEKWQKWDKRYQAGAEYNWRNHTGTRAGAQSKTPSKN